MMVGPLKKPGTNNMTEYCECFILEALSYQLCCSPYLYDINVALSDISGGAITLRFYDGYPVLRMMLSTGEYVERIEIDDLGFNPVSAEIIRKRFRDKVERFATIYNDDANLLYEASDDRYYDADDDDFDYLDGYEDIY